MLILSQLYCDLQVYKHIHKEKREQALQDWWKNYQDTYYSWNGMSLPQGTRSTLGIFYYSALAANEFYSAEVDHQAFQSYFPYVQALHILLDYLIDQEEDRQGGDLNFCFYYDNEQIKQQRILWIYQQAKQAVEKLPFSSFHRMVVDGLISIYLADPKVKKQRGQKNSQIFNQSRIVDDEIFSLERLADSSQVEEGLRLYVFKWSLMLRITSSYL